MRRKIISCFALALCVVPFAGCASSTAVKEEPRDSFWLPAARESFVTIVNDTSYAIVPDELSDVLIHEQMTGPRSRLTWIVRAPRSAPLGVTHRIGATADSPVRAWMLEEVDGEASTLAVVVGTVVIHNRAQSSTGATVVLETPVRPASAGSVLPEMRRLTLRDTWVREVREANPSLPGRTRSGAPNIAARDPGNPFYGTNEYSTDEKD